MLKYIIIQPAPHAILNNRNMKKTYEDVTRFDSLDYFEIARVALSNPEISDFVLKQCDITDEEGERLLNQLEEVLN